MDLISRDKQTPAAQTYLKRLSSPSISSSASVSHMQSSSSSSSSPSSRSATAIIELCDDSVDEELVFLMVLSPAVAVVPLILLCRVQEDGRCRAFSFNGGWSGTVFPAEADRFNCWAGTESRSGVSSSSSSGGPISLNGWIWSQRYCIYRIWPRGEGRGNTLLPLLGSPTANSWWWGEIPSLPLDTGLGLKISIYLRCLHHVFDMFGGRLSQCSGCKGGQGSSSHFIGNHSHQHLKERVKMILCPLIICLTFPPSIFCIISSMLLDIIRNVLDASSKAVDLLRCSRIWKSLKML